jgi:hypothetical protein
MIDQFPAVIAHCLLGRPQSRRAWNLSQSGFDATRFKRKSTNVHTAGC